MRILKQKYHGLPGLGINGQTGEKGKNGETVLFGFINDFFDGDIINVGTFIYAAKRTFNHPDAGALDASTLDAAWKVAQQELGVFPNAILQDAVKNSSNSSTSYINYKTFYYSGTRLTNSSIANCDGDLDSSILNDDTINDAMGVELDLIGDYISMSFMLNSLEPNFNESYKNYKSEYDETVALHFTDPDFSSNLIYNMYSINNDQTHYTFQEGSELYINFKDKNNKYHMYMPFDTNDAIYNSSVDAGKASENGSLLLNENYSNYYENINGVDYVKEVIEDKNGNNLILDTNNVIASLNDSELLTKYNTGGENNFLIEFDNDYNKLYNNATWNLFYKTSFSDIISFSEREQNPAYYSKYDLLDVDNKASYGVASPVLYDNTKGKETVKLGSIDKLVTDPFYKDRLQWASKDNSYIDALIQTKDGLNVYYSLDDNDSQLFVPRTLKNIYQPGDVIYFYANSYDFNNPNNPNYQSILYMVVLTDDLMGCTPSQLMARAQLVSPLEIKLFSFNGDRACNYQNVGVLLNKAEDNSTKMSNKGFMSITNNYTNAPALIAAPNNKILNRFVAADSSISLVNHIKENQLNIDTSTEITLKLSSLYVNPNKISENTNIELYSEVYNKHIKYYSNNFIRPLVDLDLYSSNDSDQISMFSYTINGSDYFYDIENLNDYYYGCDIYDKNMQLIKTIGSSEQTFDVDLVPSVNNDTYYFQMFASNGSSLKYYSKFTKLSITYKLFKFYNNVKEIELPKRTYYGQQIGDMAKSNKTTTEEIERYQITAFELEILGEDQSIIREKKSGNIFFNLTDINAEKVVDASLFVYAEDPSIIIDDILFNHKQYSEGSISVNNWSNITIADFADASAFNVDLSSNLPEYKSESGDVSKFDFIKDFVISGHDNTNSNAEEDEAELFRNINTSIYKPAESVQRSILVTAKYHYKDNPSEIFYENFNIVQPGFKDTRDLPVFEIKTHTSMGDLQIYNTLENGVLTNQFITYVDINIKDFKKQWGQFILDSSISLDCSIENIEYDLDWQYDYIVKDLAERRTFRVALEDDLREDSSQYKLNNYVKIDTTLFETNSKIQNNDIAKNASTAGKLLCGGNFDVNQEFLLYSTPNTGVGIEPTYLTDNYILCDSSFVNINKKSNIMYAGLQDNVTIHLSNIPICDDIDTIKLKLTAEMGNPMLANMYFMYAVKSVKINVNIDGETYSFSTKVVDDYTKTNSTYLAKLSSLEDGAKSIKRIDYKYISEPIDVTFNPLSYTVCPNDVESTYTNIYSNNGYIYGVKEQIQKELSFFNSSVYVNNPYNQSSKNIREQSLYPFNTLYIKKSYVQDNVKAINVKPVSLYDNINKCNCELYESIADISTHNILDYIEGNKYLSITYHSTIMQPKLRNDEYNFYYNDNAYLRSKYNQKNNNIPVYAYDTQSIELRDDELINAMDKWNDYYTESVKYPAAKTFDGVLSLYGNGYTQLLEANTKNVGFLDCLDIDDVVKLNNVSINLEKGINEVNIEPAKNDQPNNGEYFRGFLYDIKWEFPYYDNKNIIPYQIVSPFDMLIVNSNSKDYEGYRDSLRDSYNNMVPYNLLFDITPRIAYNFENSGINVLMLRRPSIGIDTDIIDNDEEFDQKYKFSHQLFDLIN